MGFGDYASAINTAIDGSINLGFGLYNTWRQSKDRQEDRDRESDWRYEDHAREDNAIQRRVADLRAAGLSPTLAAGSAASAAGTATNTAGESGKLTPIELARMNMELERGELENQALADRINGEDAQSQFYDALAEKYTSEADEFNRNADFWKMFGMPSNMNDPWINRAAAGANLISQVANSNAGEHRAAKREEAQQARAARREEKRTLYANKKRVRR